MKNKLKNLGFKTGEGVVVSIITAAIIKLGDWFVEVLPSIGSSLSENISNILYSLCATYSDSFMLQVLLLGSLGVLVGSLLHGILNSLKMYKSIVFIEKESAKHKAEIQNEIIEKAFKNAETKLADNDNIKTFQKYLHEGKKAGNTAISLLVIIALLYVLITFFLITPMNFYNKFSRDITKIAPYVTEQDVKGLQSDWVCMRSKADYDKIYEVINGVKEAHNLPE